MLRVFIGYDHRQPISYNVLQFSIMRRASVPVAITPIVLPTLPFKRQGLTPFTFSRFLVPWLCDYQGWAIFMDIDMLALGDIAELAAEANDKYAAMVVKNDLHFEWPSMILFNCGHPANRQLTPEYCETSPGLHKLSWLVDRELIGDLPREWNHLVGYCSPRTDAKLVHFTQGMPIYEETSGSEYSAEWRAEAEAAGSAAPWMELMGRSIHAAPSKDNTRLVARLHADAQREVAHA